MAETTGVTSSESRNESRDTRSGRGGQSAKKKRNRTLLIAGGAGAIILYMGHKGGQQTGSSKTATDAENQALTDELSALESGQLSAGGSSFDNGGTASDASGGGGSGNPSQVGSGSANDSPGEQLTPAPTPSVTNATEPSTTTAPTGTSGGDGNAQGTAAWDRWWTAKHNRQEAAKKKAANPQSAHSGGHGVTVHGRTFPGAIGHNVGPTQRVGLDVINRVTVNYGGHSDTHTSINRGRNWRDHTDGPPSRRAAASPRRATHARRR